jgi:hypothetical protein
METQAFNTGGSERTQLLTNFCDYQVTIKKLFISDILSRRRAGGWIQTLDLGISGQVLYHSTILER